MSKLDIRTKQCLDKINESLLELHSELEKYVATCENAKHFHERDFVQGKSNMVRDIWAKIEHVRLGNRSIDELNFLESE